MMPDFTNEMTLIARDGRQLSTALTRMRKAEEKVGLVMLFDTPATVKEGDSWSWSNSAIWVPQSHHQTPLNTR